MTRRPRLIPDSEELQQPGSADDHLPTLPCPRCQEWYTKIIDSRGAKKSRRIRRYTVWRRRECLTCRYRFTTRELLESDLHN